jgi:hypothetical protein
MSRKSGEPMDMEELKPEAVVASVIPDDEVYDDDVSRAMPTLEIDDLVGTDMYIPDIYDGYIAAQVLLQRGDGFDSVRYYGGEQMIMSSYLEGLMTTLVLIPGCMKLV